ncbi:MAG TPA: SCO family protein [Usitatibacter sp.]|nr:SCO family protein [Usitatibacter sp.]
MRIHTTILAAALCVSPAWAGDGHEGHEGHHEHAAQAANADRELARSSAQYAPPHVALVRQDGKRVDFASVLDDGRPVFLNFIYTTCTAICPPMSQTFATLQRKLGAERDKVHMISVSIDPEQDTPARLAEYAAQFGAGPQWEFYTGSVEASIAVQKAFGVWHGDKMSHTPLTLVRLSPGSEWVRYDGFVTAEMLARDFRRDVAAR